MKTLLILVTLIGLSAVIAAIVVGNRSFEGIVTEHPYEKGLQWEKVQDEKTSLGWEVQIPAGRCSVGKNTLTLALLDKGGRPLEGALVSITISRPSTTAYDKTYRSKALGNGSYRAEVALPLYGLWDLEVRVVKGREDVTLTKHIFAER
jgi:nitrogen fixation protein FixH